MDESTKTVRILDMSKSFTKDGITNLCRKYGSIKNVTFFDNRNKNISFVEFEDDLAPFKLIEDQEVIPKCLSVHLSYSTVKENKMNLKAIKNNETINNEDIEKTQESVYFGPKVSVSSLIEESERLKLNTKIVSYNLENDNLFGKPLNSKWTKQTFEKFDFELNNLSFSKRFEDYFGGDIKFEKKLSPNVFTGWVTNFSDGENVKTTLKSISDDIESSEILNIDNLERGMLVGAFDTVTNSYGRGYVALVSGNSVNVAMIDYGRVINATIIRVLPEKHTQTPAYSFKVYTKDPCVLQLKEKLYAFKVRSASSERIVLIIFDENEEIKVQLKIWQPSVEEIGVPYINFKNGSFVEILKLKDMNSVYLRSKQKDQVEFFFSSWNLLALYCYKHSKLLNRRPLYGEIVGFKSTIIKYYTRGRIHKYLGDDTYCVKLMDNPIKENIKLSEMIELQYEHKVIPVAFIKVGLKNALPYPIQFDAERLVKHILGVSLSVQYDESDLEGWKCVDLEMKFLKENLNNILYSLVEPSWLKDKTHDSDYEYLNDICYYYNILKNKLEENSVVRMKLVTFYDGIFYMRDNDFGKSFNLLSDMIKEYCNIKLLPYLPHIDELCLGQFPDGMWYRIKCDQLRPGQLTQVHSVDLGNVAFLNSKKMKKLPEELLFHPNHVYPCILDGSKQLNEKKLDLFELYENRDFEFTVIKHLDENHYLIKCPLLENILA